MGRRKYASSSRPGWAVELLAMFVFGFLLATMLWLGLWFFQTKPAHAAALEANKTALRNCVAAKDDCSKLKDKLQAENKETDAKLKEAVKGWGSCIRSKNAQQTPGGNTP